ncbi:MAG: UvrD-helicase domain-containing protein [Rhodanobacteraceae bacterium]
MTASGDPLQLPLDGIRTVEANAGTGKTFTIAMLYLRLILEQGLQPGGIVVATFTRAATAELSGRLRSWLALADRELSHGDARNDDRSGETRAVRAIIVQAHARLEQSGDTDAAQTLRERAREASLAIDTAQISTLHGFCFRALAEFGFDAGAALRQPEPIEDLCVLDLEITRDFWRRGSGDIGTATLLADTWGDPETLARQVGDPRWEERAIDLPQMDVLALHAAFDAARARIAAWGDAERSAFGVELQRCVKAPGTRAGRAQAWEAIRAWATEPATDVALERFDGKAVASIGADQIEELQPRGVRPEGDVFDAIATLTDAHAAIIDAHNSAEAGRGAQLLLDARSFLVQERTRRLAERNLMGHDQAVQGLRAAIAGDGGGALITKIRQRWKAALIDEFQDTDTAQWEVVRALFGDTTLILVGDPKQAIYGFRGGDVFAWRKAIASARDSAQGPSLALTTSYRSGERLCEAVNALFGVDGGFNDEGIQYRDVAASDRSRQYAVCRDGVPMPGLQCWSFDAADLGQIHGKAAAKGVARAALEQRTVHYVAAMLASATLRGGDGAEQPLQPGHIAVLVDSNRSAASLQAALSESGIPAASNLRASVYASDEADDLALLLEAPAEPADAGRARAAWASRLLGKSAADIAATLAGGDGAPQRDAAQWAADVRHRGVLAWLHGLIAAAAPRLLEQPGGARRVANYLQLAELLQAEQATSFGPAEVAARFARRRAESADDRETDSARLRLDTDADAVTVSTVHAAKGLEYDVVILPYAGLAKKPSKSGNGVALHWYHDDAGDACVALGTGAATSAARERARRETLAEDVRKLYVAITRARALCVLPWGWLNEGEVGAPFHLLHAAGHAQAVSFDDAGCAAALAGLRERAPEAIGIVNWRDIPAAARWQASRPKVAEAALRFTRTGLDRDWSVWSFSRLVRGSHNAAADTLPGAGDGDPGEIGGARFGSAVHQVFEHADFAAWRNAMGIPASQHALVERALTDHGLPGSAQAKETVGAMLRDALNVPLPCGARLADIAPHARRAEIEFHTALAPADSAKLYALLHAHGYQIQRSGIATPRLAGLLTGKIDLTFRHDGRYYIVDWKTNRCPPYDAAALQSEIARHDYDLQWLVYTLALHRWLGATLADYAYARDVGGVYYLFVRGMAEGRGVHADRPPRALIEALDALFPAPRREAA